METTQSTPIPEPPHHGGSPLRSRRWLAVSAATLAFAGAGFGIGVAQAQDSGNDATTTTEAPDAGSDNGATDTTTPETADRPTDAEIQAFRDCMAENGVDLPDERPEPGQRPERTAEEQATFDQALDACADLKPEGFGPHHGGPGCDARDAQDATEAPDARSTDS